MIPCAECTLGSKKKGHRVACVSVETVQCLCSAETVQCLRSQNS